MPLRDVRISGCPNMRLVGAIVRPSAKGPVHGRDRRLWKSTRCIAVELGHQVPASLQVAEGLPGVVLFWVAVPVDLMEDRPPVVSSLPGVLYLGVDYGIHPVLGGLIDGDGDGGGEAGTGCDWCEERHVEDGMDFERAGELEAVRMGRDLCDEGLLL